MPRVTAKYTPPSVNIEAKSVAKKAIYTGAIAAAAGYFLLGESSGDIGVFGVTLPTSIASGVGAAAGSVVSDLFTDYVIKATIQSAAVSELEQQSVKLGLAAAGSMSALYLGAGVSPSIMAAVVGAGSKAGGDYTYQNLDSSLLGMLY